MSDSIWKNQVASLIKTTDRLAEYIDLDEAEVREIRRAQTEFSWHITPYYAGLMDRSNRRCPMRLQAVPTGVELETIGTAVLDPLEEERHNPAPNVIQVYPDRVAWTVSNVCPVLCRHCLRKRMVGRESFVFTDAVRDKALEYIASNRSVRDVLITGGDPLMRSDGFIDDILGRLRMIDHVEIVRIGSRTPCTMPQRITPELCRVLRKHHPLWLNTQFNHPDEVTDEAAGACAMLADAGIPLGNQSVLLKGINDDPGIMLDLVRKLVRIRVRPYYIYQAQTLTGTSHFITPIEKGLQIISALRGFTTGFAVPVYLLDTPYGKIPMYPESIVKRDAEAVYLKAWNGKVWREPNPVSGR